VLSELPSSTAVGVA